MTDTNQPTDTALADPASINQGSGEMTPAQNVTGAGHAIGESVTGSPLGLGSPLVGGAGDLGQQERKPPVQVAAPISMGRIVIVRELNRRDAPGIVVDIHDEGVITCNVFRGDHVPHVSANLPQISPNDIADRGWYWPQRV